MQGAALSPARKVGMKNLGGLLDDSYGMLCHELEVRERRKLSMTAHGEEAVISRWHHNSPETRSCLNQDSSTSGTR